MMIVPFFLWILALISLGLSFFYLLQILVFSAESKKSRDEFCDVAAPPVSVLKPIKSLTPEIEACVASFFQTVYPDFELVFAVDRFGDQAHQMIQALQEKFPQASCRVIATGHNDSINPKVHKLMAMERIATGKLFWITDANVRVEARTLANLVDEMKNRKVKLLFTPVRGCGSGTMASLMENSYINSFLSGSIIAAWKTMKHAILVGKSILLERESIEHFGGFSFFRQFLAEDYVMGDSYRRCAMPMALSRSWTDNLNQSTTLSGFFRRTLRWAQLRYRIRPAVYLLEPLANPVIMAFIAFLAGGLQAGGLLTAFMTLKILFELWGFHRLEGWGRRKILQFVLFPCAVMIKDLIMLAVFLIPFVSNRIRWNGAPIAIGPWSRIHGAELEIFEGV